MVFFRGECMFYAQKNMCNIYIPLIYDDGVQVIYWIVQSCSFYEAFWRCLLNLMYLHFWKSIYMHYKACDMPNKYHLWNYWFILCFFS